MFYQEHVCPVLGWEHALGQEVNQGPTGKALCTRVCPAHRRSCRESCFPCMYSHSRSCTSIVTHNRIHNHAQAQHMNIRRHTHHNHASTQACIIIDTFKHMHTPKYTCTTTTLICILIVYKGHTHTCQCTHTYIDTPAYKNSPMKTKMCAYCHHILSYVCVSVCAHTCKAMYTYQCVHRMVTCMYLRVVIGKCTYICPSHIYTHIVNSFICKYVDT